MDREPVKCAFHELAVGSGCNRGVVKLTNCRVFRDGKLVRDDVWVQNGVVIDPATRFWEAADATQFACDVVVDCRGHILSAGFIDAQFNGAYGVDFTDPGVTEDAILSVLRRLPETGVTSVCPTVITSAPSTYAAVVATVSTSTRASGGTRQWYTLTRTASPCCISHVHRCSCVHAV